MAGRSTTTPLGRSSSGQARPLEEIPNRRGLGPGLAVLALPVLCCGGPLVVAALGAASAATLGVVGGVVGGALAVVAVALWVRHQQRATFCAPVYERANGGE